MSASLLAGEPLSAQDPVFDAKGFQPNREFFSELPFEHIDPMTGNLLLTFTDLVLPGNAGFDLRIQRTYNSKIYSYYDSLGGYILDEDSWAGIGWTLHMGRVLNPNDPNLAPIVEMPDGSQHQLYRHMDGNPNHYITKDYWTYDNVFQFPVLRLPNGLKYTFGHSRVPAGPAYVTQIEDPFGNKVVVTYASPPAPGDVIASVQQQLVGGQQTRTVTFTYNETLPDPSGQQQAAGSLATMTFSGRTWTYTQKLTNLLTYTLLMDVQPPVGPPWAFGYNETNPATQFVLVHVDTPNGGDLDYTYTPQVFYIGSSVLYSPAVTQRQTSGRDVPAGTWDYEYSSSIALNETEITTPCGIKTTYSFLGIGPNANQDPWAIGALDKRITTDGTGVVVFETEDLTWIASVPISNVPDPPLFQTHVALLGKRDITRSGQTYTTEYTYSTHPYDSSRPDNFNDYGRANNIAETGDLARTTSRAFFYGSSNDPSFGTYIVDKIAADTVQLGSEAFTRSYTYDAANGFKTSETIYGIKTTYTNDFPGSGNVGRSTDANNHSTSYDYDWGVAKLIQTPEYTISRAVNGDSTIASETRRGFTTSFLYDSLSRPTRTTPPVGNPIVTSYDNTDGTFVRVTRGASELTTSLDGFGRASATSNTVGIKTEVTYDACGRRTFESYPFVGNTPTGTTYTYDPLGRVTRRTHPNGDFIAYAYPFGVDVDITDEEQRLTRQDWSAFGDPAGDARLVQVTDAKGVTTQHTFNALGNLKSVTLPGGGPLRTWAYNTRNELITETHPENGSTSYTYDPAGNLKARTDAQFGTTTFGYDRNDRLTGIDRPGSAHDVAIGYDASDNRTALVTSDVSSGFAYDSANRLVSREDDLDGVVLRTGYAYDANDNLSRLTYPSGARVDYSYDSENRLTRVANGIGTNYADQFSYHPSGAPTSYRAGNNLLHQFTYDPRYRLRTLNAGGSSRLRLTYTYDRVSNVTRIDDARGAQFSYSNLQYDTLDRLRQVTGAFGAPRFDYDAKGNRLYKQIGTARTDYTYDAASQLLLTATGAEPESFSYDLNGNTTANGAGSYTYTPTNMLASSLVGGSSTSYIYDGDDLRKVKIAATGISYYVHGPGGQLLGEYKDNAGALSVVHEYVLAGTRLIAEVSPTVLAVNPAALEFLVVLDQPTPEPQTISLTTNGGSVVWNATASDPWLIASPASGTTPATLRVSINPADLTPGSHSGSISITASGAVNSPVVVPVDVIVFQTASLYLSPSALSFYQPAGGPNPQPGTFRVLYPGEPVLWQATPVEPWISVSPQNGTTPGTVTVSVSGQGLPSGTHRGSVIVTAQGVPGSPQTLAVELVIGPAPGQGCSPDASYCEIFDDEPPGNLAAGWIWAEPNVPQVVTDPRGAGQVMLLDPPAGKRLNGDVNLVSPHAISGTEISVQIMTTGTTPAIPLSLAKIEFYTKPGGGWAKTTRTFGTLRFGSTLRFQYGPTQYQMLVNPMQPGRWYAVRVRFEGGQAEVYVDGVLKFTTAAPDADLQLEAFSLTAWDFAPGAAYVDVLESRPGELVVDPMELGFQSSPPLGFARTAAATTSRAIPSLPAPSAAPQRPSQAKPIRLPVAFEANVGQADPSVRFLARGPGYLLLVRPTDLIMAVPPPRPLGVRRRALPAREHKLSLIRMGLRGAKNKGPISGLDERANQSHYFWRDPVSQIRALHASRYSRVVSRDVYPGVDLLLHGERGRIEYDLVVDPGADPAQIELEFEGPKGLRIADGGDLVLTAAQGQELRQPRPVAYQEVGGVRRVVEGRYALRGPRIIGFELGAYDRSLPLVIDPVLVWTAQLGGFHIDEPSDIAADAAGDVYVTGETLSPDFPILNPFQPTLAGSIDAFVAKLTANGSLVYSSYLGGTGSEIGVAIAVDDQGNAFIAGSTSGGFPVTNAPTFGPGGRADAFIAMVSADGSQLLHSTTVGGSGDDVLSDMSLDVSGRTYLVGDTVSLDFPEEPPLPTGKNGGQDGFVTAVSADFQQLVYSFYLGGNEVACQESAEAVAVGPGGDVFVAGITDAPDFPGANNCATPQDVFLTRLSLSGSIVASRCLGGSARDTALSIAAGTEIVVTGTTESPDFPTVQPLQVFGGGPSDAFVATLTDDLATIAFSSPLGGSDQEVADAVSLSSTGAIYLAGWTFSQDFPVVGPASCGNPNYMNAFVVKLNSTTGFEYSTYLDDDEHGGQRATGIAAYGSGAYVSWAEAQEVFVGRVLDQTPPGTVQFAAPAASVNEGDTVSAKVERTGGEAGTLVVDYETQDGTATAPLDYDGTPGSVFLDDKVCSAEIQVPTNDDGLGEANETFTINLTGVTGNATVGMPSSLVATIVDNDGGGGGGLSGQFTVSHRSQPTGPTWQATVEVGWLTLDAYSGTGPSTVTATVDPTGLVDGTYTGRITVTASDATGSPQEILVTLVVLSQLQ